MGAHGGNMHAYAHVSTRSSSQARSTLLAAKVWQRACVCVWGGVYSAVVLSHLLLCPGTAPCLSVMLTGSPLGAVFVMPTELASSHFPPTIALRRIMTHQNSARIRPDARSEARTYT